MERIVAPFNLAVIVGTVMFLGFAITVDNVTWDSAISVALFLVPVTWFGVVKYRGKRRKNKLFTVVHEPVSGATKPDYRTVVSGNKQTMNITLTTAMDTHVEFLSAYFDGSGTKPRLEWLSDWQWDESRKPPYFEDVYQVPKDELNRWYVTFGNWHRAKDARIKIRVSYKADRWFNGHLVLDLTTTHGNRLRKLPFKVEETS